MFLINSRMGSFAAAPPHYQQIMRRDCSSDIEFFVFETYRQATTANSVAGQTLSRSYGRCIAEFLNEESLVRLGLLDLSTCVGLRYG